MSHLCDNCGELPATLECKLCTDFRFCGEECEAEMQGAHHAVCYDVHCTDRKHLEELLFTMYPISAYPPQNIPDEEFVELAHELIEDHLEHSDFSHAAQVLIEARPRAVIRKRRRENRKVKRDTKRKNKKTRKTKKNTSGLIKGKKTVTKLNREGDRARAQNQKATENNQKATADNQRAQQDFSANL